MTYNSLSVYLSPLFESFPSISFDDLVEVTWTKSPEKEIVKLGTGIQKGNLPRQSQALDFR